MISWVLKKFSGSHYKKFVKKCEPVVRKINKIEEGYQKLSDAELQAKTPEFMKRVQEGESLDDILPEAFAAVKNAARRLCGQTINVCEHEDTWNMIHYDVQLIGGMALHERKIAEMATGEGKTLVSTCPLYLNALSGKNCQLVTVNEYLAQRDSEWMGHLFKWLGLTVGCIQNSMDPQTKQEMYGKNITYGTASEFGFDYLRDNGLATEKENQVQKEHFYCIIDEADSILIDEARTPLIISGPMQEDRPLPFKDFKAGIKRLFSQQQTLCGQLMREVKAAIEKEGEESQDAIIKLFQVKHGMPKNEQLLSFMENGNVRKALDKFEAEMHSEFNKDQAYRLKEELYFTIDEKNHNADLTEKGRTTLRPNNPDAFVLPDLPSEYMEIDKVDSTSQEDKDEAKNKAQARFERASEEIHTISQMLKAYALYERDKEYVVKEGKVMIVDENTGRLMSGRRWSNGLHQAVEAKENVTIEKETKTYATITIQNYFRMYEKLAGMTGTAETEVAEFSDIYGLGVMVIPTNKPCKRIDHNDVIYKTRREKFGAVIKDVKEANEKGQPILVGTASVEASETLAKLLKKANVRHTVLNAKFHQMEAEIVARAGQKGAVTIATNMAGRGTDIKLGEGVEELGGLMVLGTERHDSRRVDRQLRGRCARQGDSGVSKFYISLEDDLMRLFANAGPISKILQSSFQEGEELEHSALNWSIENAQKKVEQQNYSIRKRLLQYDDVFNRQREVIYEIRNEALHSETPRDIIFEMINEEVETKIDEIPENNFKDSQDITDIEAFLSWLNTTFPIALKEEDMKFNSPEELKDFVLEKIKAAYEIKEKSEDPEALVFLERYVIIRSIDKLWQDHLTEMEELRRSVGLRGYGQKDPLNEFKSEAFVYFGELMSSVRQDICSGSFRSATGMEAFQNMMSMLNADQEELASPSQASAAQQEESNEGKKEIELPKVQVRQETPKVGRNDPCPCGSGKKHKKCCGM